MRRSALLALAAILPLAACGGGSGAGAGTGPGGPQARGYAQVMAEAADLRDGLAGQREVGRSQLPATGSATYAGYLTLDSAGFPARVVGDMSMSVDFADNDTSALAGNFVGADGTAYDGRLYGRGTVTASGLASATASLGGTLQAGSRDWDIRVDARGDFLAPDGALIEGTTTTRGGVNGRDVTAAMILALE